MGARLACSRRAVHGPLHGETYPDNEESYYYYYEDDVDDADESDVAHEESDNEKENVCDDIHMNDSDTPTCDDMSDDSTIGAPDIPTAINGVYYPYQMIVDLVIQEHGDCEEAEDYMAKCRRLGYPYCRTQSDFDLSFGVIVYLWPRCYNAYQRR